MATLLLASCDKEETATGNATVGFASEKQEFGLGSDYIHIPIQTTGESSVYPIKIELAVAPYSGEFAATEDVDYIITSKEIFVASAESTPSIEVRLLNPEDADELRFALEITSADNAQSISVKNTTIACAKSDLDRVCGKWKAEGFSYSSGEDETQTWVITNKDGHLYMGNMFIDGDITYNQGIEGDFKDGVLSFELGFGNTIGVHKNNSSYLMTPVFGRVQDGKIYRATGTLEGRINESFDTIVWDLDPWGLMLYVYNPSGAGLGYWQAPFMINNNTITKLPKK